MNKTPRDAKLQLCFETMCTLKPYYTHRVILQSGKVVALLSCVRVESNNDFFQISSTLPAEDTEAQAYNGNPRLSACVRSCAGRTILHYLNIPAPYPSSDSRVSTIVMSIHLLQKLSDVVS